MTICETCEGTGRIDLEPDGHDTHPCEDCNREAFLTWRYGGPFTKFLYKSRGWIFIRPLRWFMWKISASSFGIRWKPERSWDGSWRMPNIHWWIMYKTVGKFFLWLKWDAWRVFCNWEGGWRRTFPLPARIIHRIGTVACYSFYGGTCYHCGSVDGEKSGLSEDETGRFFKLTDSGTSYTPDGTDHWFRGITTCPRCGYQGEYGDSSL